MVSARCPIQLICGGQSPEHGISLSSGRTATTNIDHARYAVFPVYIRRDGLWAAAVDPLSPRADAEEIDALFFALRAEDDPSTSPQVRILAAGNAVSRARIQGIQAILLLLHGALGEDGTIQGMLEMEGLAYAGSGVLASALAMDKVRCQRYLKACGLPVAPFLAEEGPFDPQALAQFAGRAEREIGIPCVVKPSRAGSSVGISIVHEKALLPGAIQSASAIDSLVMIERHEEGEEVTCAVLEFREAAAHASMGRPGKMRMGIGSQDHGQDARATQVSGGERPVARAMPVTAIRPKRSSFFDYNAKYTPGECDEITPAPIGEEATRQIQRLSVEAFEALGCRDMARVDFILGQQGPVLLEVNTIPGLTPTSLLPQGAAHAGISFPALLDLLIQNALARASASGVPRSKSNVGN